MKAALTALYITMALSLVGTGLIVYKNQAQTYVQDVQDIIEEPEIPEDFFIPVAKPDQAEVNHTMEEFDFQLELEEEEANSAHQIYLQGGVLSCAFCGKNAFTAFTACPAAVAQDGLNPWTDFKCIASVLKLPSNCKKCFCAIAHHYRRRVRGC